jgi:vancomycin resistance protein YoaR
MLQNLAQADKKERLTVKNPVIKSSGDELVVKAGTNGRRIIYGENVYGFMAKVGRLDDGFAILTAEIAPAYTEDELRESLVAAREVSEKGLALKYGANTYRVEPAVIASWFSLRSGAAPMGMRLEDNFLSAIREQPRASIHYFNTAAIENHLSGIAKKIDRDPVNATLTMKTGKVDVFALSRTGLSLDINLSAEAIITALDSGAVKANLVVTEVEPEITKNSLANLGIVELIAEGRSNFAGSPANRRHNIRVGAARFNGIIIEPRETFSFTKNLGAVDASTGYLPELVIKANETIPEFGGGLCQVSSTAFRAALNAGLPITARKQHAYPVTYYKPYGTDATIYIPNPDLKFVNDTGHHILIQTRIVGNFLYFDFYGTKKEITVKFAGNKEGTGAVGRIENVRPLIYDSGVRGVGSFTAVFWHFIYDPQGKLLETDSFVSKYDSPLKYPH